MSLLKKEAGLIDMIVLVTQAMVKAIDGSPAWRRLMEKHCSRERVMEELRLEVFKRAKFVRAGMDGEQCPLPASALDRGVWEEARHQGEKL